MKGETPDSTSLFFQPSSINLQLSLQMPDAPTAIMPTGQPSAPSAPVNSAGSGTVSAPSAPDVVLSTAAPAAPAAASVTINPTGANNSVTYTANVAGTDGNNIQVSYDEAAASAATSVAVEDSVITVTPGTKARMIVTGTLTDGTDPVVFPDLIYGGIENGKAVFTVNGTTVENSSYYAAWNSGAGIWELTASDGLANWFSFDAVATPDLVTTWTPNAPSTGTPIVTPGVSSAAQVIAAVNADASAAALVTASASGTVTGAVATITPTSLAGGVGANPPTAIQP